MTSLFIKKATGARFSKGFKFIVEPASTLSYVSGYIIMIKAEPALDLAGTCCSMCHTTALIDKASHRTYTALSIMTLISNRYFLLPSKRIKRSATANENK